MPYSCFYVGDVGSGKTLMAVIQAIIDANVGREIWTNVDLAFKHKHVNLIDLINIVADPNSDVTNIPPKTLILDETHTQIDSRSSASWMNKHASYFFSQSRKMGFNVIYVSQFLSGYDIRMRKLTQFVVNCHCYRKNDASETPIAFEYMTWSTRMQRIVKRWLLPADLAKAFYPYYDTMQKIVPAEVAMALAQNGE